MSEGVATFNSLPREVVLYHIVPYLPNADICRLCQVNSALRRLLSNERILNLWSLYEREYLRDAEFRREFSKWLPRDRLLLTAFVRRTNLEAFEGIHTADLVDRSVAHFLPHIRGVPVVRCGTIGAGVSLDALADATVILTDVLDVRAALPSFTRLREFRCNRVRSGPAQDHKALDLDVTPFATVETLELQSVRDLSPLRRPRRVLLRGCPNLVDLSPLASAQSVKLVDCPRVVDYSPLSALRSVAVIHSRLAAVPAALSRVRRLDFTGSSVLVDVAAAANAHTLILRNCDRLGYVSMLGGVHHLDLSFGPDVKNGVRRDVRTLGRVHTLVLTRNVAENTAGLGGNHFLDLRVSQFLGDTDFSALSRVHTLLFDAAVDASHFAGSTCCVWNRGWVRPSTLRISAPSPACTRSISGAQTCATFPHSATSIHWT
eukprot:Opistho-1_new@74838